MQTELHCPSRYNSSYTHLLACFLFCFVFLDDHNFYKHVYRGTHTHTVLAIVDPYSSYTWLDSVSIKEGNWPKSPPLTLPCTGLCHSFISFARFPLITCYMFFAFLPCISLIYVSISCYFSCLFSFFPSHFYLIYNVLSVFRSFHS